MIVMLWVHNIHRKGIIIGPFTFCMYFASGANHIECRQTERKNFMFVPKKDAKQCHDGTNLDCTGYVG